MTLRSLESRRQAGQTGGTIHSWRQDAAPLAAGMAAATPNQIHTSQPVQDAKIRARAWRIRNSRLHISTFDNNLLRYFFIRLAQPRFFQAPCTKSYVGWGPGVLALAWWDRQVAETPRPLKSTLCRTRRRPVRPKLYAMLPPGRPPRRTPRSGKSPDGFAGRWRRQVRRGPAVLLACRGAVPANCRPWPTCEREPGGRSRFGCAGKTVPRLRSKAVCWNPALPGPG